MQIMDDQHRDWYIASLFPHLILSLSQQKISTQAKALDFAMRLATSTIQDIHMGVQQIQSQLASLHMESHSLKRGKEVQTEVHTKVLSFKCKGHGHDNDVFLVY